MKVTTSLRLLGTLTGWMVHVIRAWISTSVLMLMVLTPVHCAESRSDRCCTSS